MKTIIAILYRVKVRTARLPQPYSRHRHREPKSGDCISYLAYLLAYIPRRCQPLRLACFVLVCFGLFCFMCCCFAALSPAERTFGHLSFAGDGLKSISALIFHPPYHIPIALGQEAMSRSFVLRIYITATAFSNRPLVLFSMRCALCSPG